VDRQRQQEKPMRRRLIAPITGVALLASAGGGIAVAGASGTSAGSAPPSRLDDGRQYLSQASITEQQAIKAAQGASSGALNEIDLEQYEGRLVFNVDVGGSDVKVDAADGSVLGTPADD
jgi:uncharacterized membrane protein YkoI